MSLRTMCHIAAGANYVRNSRIRSTSPRFSESSHSQITITRHPAAFRAAQLLSSRSIVRENFRSQKRELVLGVCVFLQPR